MDFFQIRWGLFLHTIRTFFTYDQDFFYIRSGLFLHTIGTFFTYDRDFFHELMNARISVAGVTMTLLRQPSPVKVILFEGPLKFFKNSRVRSNFSNFALSPKIRGSAQIFKIFSKSEILIFKIYARVRSNFSKFSNIALSPKIMTCDTQKKFRNPFRPQE